MPSILHGLLSPFVLRDLIRHPGISLLSALSIALGVAVYLAVQIASHSADQAFRAGMDMVSGRSHLEVRAGIGALDEELYRTVQSTPGVAAATPVVEGHALLPDFPSEYLKLVGVDLFSHQPFQTSDLTLPLNSVGSESLAPFLGESGHVILAKPLADRLALEVGSTLTAEINGTTTTLTVALLRPPQEGVSLPEHVAAIDIGWAQELLNSTGQLTTIQVLAVDPSPTGIADLESALRTALPEGVTIQHPAQRSAQVGLMLEGFKLNLTALSMVSALVGVFLVYNAVAASVVRRRGEIGTLRALGTTRNGIRFLFLSKALLLALLGILIGIPLGIALSQFLVTGVSETISVHYIIVKAREATIAPHHLLISAAYGIAAALAGAWLPASEAASTDPAETLRGTTIETPRKQLLLTPFFLLIFAAAISSYFALSSNLPVLSFAACFFIVVAFAAIIPTITTQLTPLLARISARLPWELSCAALVRSIRRNTMTIASLMAAVAMMVGVSVMIHSFRETVIEWVDQVMVADLFITPAANESLGMVAYLPDDLATTLSALPEVTDSATYRELSVTPPDGSRPFSLAISEGRAQVKLIEGNLDTALSLWKLPEEDQIIVNEPYANRFQVTVGDNVSLLTPAGERSFTILGVSRDYAKDIGQVVLHRATYAKYWDDTRVHSLALFFDEDLTSDQLTTLSDRIRTLSPNTPLAVHTSRSLREEVLVIFDQTFAVTYVLRIIAIFVAIVGVILGLTTLVRERTREIGVLRAIGASPRQIRNTYLCEAGLIGFWAALIGLTCGLCLALILTHIVNPAFFGWTIDLRFPLLELALIPLWIPIIAALAATSPASRAAKTQPAAAIREE